MALAGTDRGTGGSNTASGSLTCSPSSNFAAGSKAVLKIAYENTASAGADPYASIADDHGNTWTPRQDALFDPGASGAGVVFRIFESPMNVATLTTASVVTVSLSGSNTAKWAFAFEQVASDAGGVPTFVTGGKGSGSSAGTPTVTTGSIPVGDMVCAGGGLEAANVWTGDSDTTNGSWSTKQSVGFGSGTSGDAVISQRKIQTTTASTQTYNPTATGSVDCIVAWVQYHEAFDKSGTFSVSHGHSTTPAGTKAGSGTISASHAHTTSAAGSHAGAGTLAVSHAHSATTVGAKGANGTISASHGHTTSDAGTKGGLGAPAVSHAHTVDFTGEASQSEDHSGSFTLDHGQTLTWTGRKDTAAGFTLDHGHTTTPAGAKAAAGSPTLSHPHDVAIAGAHGALDVFTVDHAHLVDVLGAHAGAGPFAISHAHTTSATGSTTETHSGAFLVSHPLASAAAGTAARHGALAVDHAHATSGAGIPARLGGFDLAHASALAIDALRASAGAFVVVHPAVLAFAGRARGIPKPGNARAGVRATAGATLGVAGATASGGQAADSSATSSRGARATVGTKSAGAETGARP